MNKQLLLSEFLTTPWALMPERLQAMTGVLSRWHSGDPPSEETMLQVNADRLIRESRKQFASANAGAGIAVLPLYGVVTQRGNMVDDISGPGSTSTQQFAAALRQVLADETVGQILIDIDSPGGSVYGVAELAAEITRARTQKPVIAVANSLAASAAYWIGCAASELYVTPGGEVGSIGVWQAHFDYSKALEEDGVKRRAHEVHDANNELTSQGLPSLVLPGVEQRFLTTAKKLEKQPLETEEPNIEQALQWLLQEAN